MADIPETNNSVELTHNTQSPTPLTSVSSGDNLSGPHLEPDKLGGEKRNGTRYIKPTTPTARDRWGRLKSTMAATSGMAKKKSGLDRGDSFLRKFSTRNQAEETVTIESEEDKTHTDRSYSKHRTCSSYVIHPSGGLMFYWLGVVTLSVLYNLWTCIAREAFREIQDGYMVVWFSLDAFSDFIYVCDIFVQFRTGYLQQGLMVYDSKKLCINYMKSKPFIIDLLCLLPLDFVQFYTGIHAMLRFPRFIKIYRSVRFMHMYESRTAYPNLLRVLNLSHILFLGSHWFAAFYYLISEAEGFEGGWSYPEPKGMYAAVTRKYLASLYWSTLTLTTIGDLPPPDTNWQYVFVIVSYLIGVFIFATIVGQVGNVITNRNASRQEFERLLDGAKFYMQMHNVPPDLQKRVQRWYDYVWTRGRLNCNDINSLGLLPDKLKTELALHVNLGTLRKVTIFQKCRPEFLHDLMLKMRAYIFTPGDLICRRGEVAREMFIIADGVVEILGENATVLTQMSTGDFFGEIGILNLDGGINRRTADVRSVGYSELFVLSREDVLAALKDHPDAEQIIREYGQRRLRETEEHRKMIRSAPCSPDPSSAWKGSKMQNKNTQNTEHSNLLHLPQVKCFQNLQMSPKLRKVFHLRQKRSKSKVNDKFASEEKTACDPQKTGSFKKETTAAERRRSFQMDHNKTYPMQSLDVIQEKDHSDVSDCDHSDRETKETGAGNFNLARAVLNLIRSQKQAEYMAIHGEEASDGKKTTGNSDVKTGSRNLQKSQSETSSDAGQRRDQNKNGVGDGGGGSKIVGMRKYHSVDSKNKKPPLPKIILTDEKRQISSTSSSDDDSEDDDDDEAQTPTSSTIPIRPGARDSIGRKSSPCVLTLPSSFHDRMNRRISLPPPLDLPIEVPNFSNFHGLTRNSTDVSHTIDRFKDTMERRMDDLENSYKETVAKLEETTRNQERFMRTIIKRLSVGKGKSLRHRAEGRASIIRESDDVVPLSQTELESNENTDSVENTKESANVDIDIQTIEQQTKIAASEHCQDVTDPDTECCDPDGQACDPETELYNPDAQCDDPDEQLGDPDAPDGSGSSTEETLSKEKYANNPSVDYLRTSSLDSSRQSSTDSLPYSMNGIRKLDPFQLVEEKHPDNSDVTDKLEHQFDEVRVTHL